MTRLVVRPFTWPWVAERFVANVDRRMAAVESADGPLGFAASNGSVLQLRPQRHQANFGQIDILCRLAFRRTTTLESFAEVRGNCTRAVMMSWLCSTPGRRCVPCQNRPVDLLQTC